MQKMIDMKTLSIEGNPVIIRFKTKTEKDPITAEIMMY